MSKIKVKVTKVMAKRLNECFPKYHITFEELTPRAFGINVSYDAYRHEEDWDYEKGVFKTIKVSYPYEFYAMPMYLTTEHLRIACKDCNGTFEDFVRSVANMICI